MRAGEGILISTYKQEQAKDLSEVAKNQQTDPLSLLENLQGYLKNLESEDQSKAAAFKQAIMLLASPSSIALESNEDIHLSGDGQINQIAQGSINTSTQDSIIGHASKKISLFAAQEGARLYAVKGKIEIQAQGDGADLIAKKGVQIISTEDVIDFKSAKEIILTAGGSQLRITGSGIFPTTGGKFEVKAGQHQFVNGKNVSAKFPALPTFKLLPNKLELKYIYDDLKPVAQAPFKLIFADGSSQEGVLDAEGYAKVTIPSDKTQPKVYYGFSSVEAKPDREKVDNPFKDQKVMSVTEAEQLIEKYNQQELDALLDEYFPDEIEEMLTSNNIEYDDHVSDYEEQLIPQQNDVDDAIADDLEEILLTDDSTSRLDLGDKQ